MTLLINAQMNLSVQTEGGHMVGSNNREFYIKERAISKVQADKRVRRRRALQILAGEDESPRSNPQSYPIHIRCKMDPEKKFNQWAIEKSFTQEIGSIPATIRWNNQSEYFNEFPNEKESNILSIINSIRFPQFKERIKVEIIACDKIN